MAVKQNSAENSNHASSAKKQKSSKQNQQPKHEKINPQAGSSQNCSINNEVNKENRYENVSNHLTIEMILMCFEKVHKKQDDLTLNETLNYCSDFIRKMAELPEPHDASEIKLFKENIQGIGKLLEGIASYNREHTQNFYLKYLNVVCELIATDGFDPCYAIAIIFQLFPDDFILNAVILPLITRTQNDERIIKKSVRILCDWLRKCTFCSNLNLWILAIFSELKKDVTKYNLLIETSLLVIEPLTIALIIPILRPKVYPIVFEILTSFKDSPVVFHKTVTRMPLVLKQLKKECETTTENQQQTKKIFHELVDLMAALTENFPNHQDLYKQLNEIILQCQKSYEYRSALIGGNSLYLSDPQMDYNNAVILNNPKVGLVNLGNTCYMNSVLQALLMTKDFCRDILLLKSKTQILYKIQQFFALLLHSSRPELTPSVILQVARPPGFSPGFQQDSSEFLGYFLETLHEQELKSIKAGEQLLKSHNDKLGENKLAIAQNEQQINGAVAENCDVDVIDSVEISKGVKLEDNLTLEMEIDEIPNNNEIDVSKSKDLILTTIDKNFTGKIVTTYKCLVCDFESKNIDSFRELQLSFPDQKHIEDGFPLTSHSSDNSNSYSIQNLLDFHCSTEKLNGDNQYFCEKCKKLCDGERSQNYVIPPINLIVTLKQFKYDQKYNMRAKLMHRIHLNQNLSLNIISQNDNNKIETIDYCMYAAVVHTGFNMDSGHYYTYAKDAKNPTNIDPNGELDQIWFKFNDNYVTECSEIELYNINPPNTPYILFYRMKSRSRLDGCKTEIKPSICPFLDELPLPLKNYVNEDNVEYKAEKERCTQPDKVRLILRLDY
ncbi:ubiquitin carboxyl-terminal hydrolase 38 isoform X2 [Condylostylus longicornis]|nr:ubiquitin carboxyl-terminal hydrolase 38 isoform X2 [Condylostylus longicornis]XP_055379581.1 ubiquitin carboxyl-terminal hydrolase 38 isoform X2 [Condylostylus longicornis]XP_055379582.1 ubiquitin carboxyl-terminal hydrolase 38 isoform X2 [Condylostylus longicornis]XP_055379583.1 ubiquitin carboxyl-terminal hydrolase 38 isoform X2 [Condylostylus longicornis]XP_055379584.1 ubiquitin carboxyl-terminal hydrolase 38 isoform X2 [Condylostylus longicornis]